MTVVILRKRQGFNFLRVNNIYKVASTENLNIDKLAMGFRLNFNIFSSAKNERNYIALITNQQDTLSDYFIKWVAISDFLSNDKNTLEFNKIIKSIDPPTGDDGLKKKRDVFQKEVFDFVESSP